MIIFFWTLFCFASAATLLAWFKGSIFQNLRDAIDAKLDAVLVYHASPDLSSETFEVPEGTSVTASKPGWPHNLVNRMPTLLLKLLSCPFCLSFHIPVWLFVLFAGPAALLASYGYTLLAGAFFAPIALLATTFVLLAFTKFTGQLA